MARIRSIKPEFWTDEKLIECSLSARLLFIGTWNFADDAGNLDRSAKQIKARVFPVDNIDCEPLIQELITHGLLNEYSVNDKKYLHIHGFAKHQLINRPSLPTCPAFDDSLVTHVILTESSQPEGKGLEGNGLKALSGKPDLRPQCVEIIEFLNAKSGKAFKPVEAHFKFIRARIKEGHTVQDFKSVIARKVKDWKGDPKMDYCLRPKTLFNDTNFANYVGQLVVEAPHE